MKVVDIKTKKLTIGDFIVDGVFKTKIINWYLNDTDSRKGLENHCIKLDEEYKYNLSGDCRSRWTHLRCLLNGEVGDKMKEILFESENEKEINQKEVELIRRFKSNDPQIGYNQWPKFKL